MNNDLHGVWEHIRELGLGALAHANRHSAYMSMENPRWPELAVVQAAHAAELIIKARIAQEHPLLIFEQYPRPTKAENDKLSVKDLFEHGRTIQWSDLPDRLWATTGITIPNLGEFKSFGKRRNGLQHFAPVSVDVDLSEYALRFIFEVIDPFIHECWGLYAVDYDEDYEPYIYFIGKLVRHEILFLVSKEAARCYQYWDVDWSNVSSTYRIEIDKRVEKALKG